LLKKLTKRKESHNIDYPEHFML